MIALADTQSAARSAAQAITAALEDRPFDAVGHALDAALALVPEDELAAFLTEAGVRRAKAIKAIADAAKFGSLGSGQ